MILSDVSNLSRRSSVIIDVNCDICNLLFHIKYINYSRSNNKDGNYICKTCRTKRTNLEKYGVENPSQSKDVKEKKKETTFENFGVSHPSKSPTIKEKKKLTNLEKLGVENPFQSENIKEKVKATNIKLYGVENPSQSKEVKEKKKETTFKNWGVEHPLQSDILLEKVKSTNLERFGSVWVLSNEVFKDKIKETNISKFGVDNPMKSNIVKENLKEHNRIKWNVDFFYQSDEFKEKSSLTKIERFGNSSFKRSDIFYSNTIIGNDQNFIKYLGESVSLFRCGKGHNFEIKADNYHSRKNNNIPLCTKCNPIGDLKSIKEKEFYEWVRSVYKNEIIQSYRNGLEIDVYLPDLNIGFEFNGLYYHSEKFRTNNYHLNKTNYFKNKGINIIHIWEDDWDLKNDTIKSQIKNWLGISEFKLYARKCHIREVLDNKVVKDFLDLNHIQGWVGSKVKLGLFYNDELVSLMVFDQYEGRKKMEEGGWNLSRFCNKLNYNVIGGESKLLNYFINLKKPTRIVSYADRTWTSGNMYYKLGFNMVDQTKPDYKYIIKNKREHKSRFRKSNLNTNLSEKEYMKSEGINRIYDCGKVKFEKFIFDLNL